MSTYWNKFDISIINNTSSPLIFGTPTITNGTVQLGKSIAANTPIAELAFTGRSSNNSTAGASGIAVWQTRDGVKITVTYNAPNTGEPSGIPAADGAGAGNYMLLITDPVCDGRDCDNNSGFRFYSVTLTISLT